MEQLKSVEDTLIKISLRSLYFLASALVGGAVCAALLYANIMAGQNDILVEVKKNALERTYQIMEVKKDVTLLDKRVSKLESR